MQEFEIIDSEKTIAQISTLMGKDKVLSAGIVLQNLVARHKYDSAIKLWEKYSKEASQGGSKYALRTTRESIQEAKVGYNIFQLISLQSVSDDQLKELFKDIKEIKDKYWKKRQQTDFSTVVIGMSKDGIKPITLAGIYPKNMDRCL